MKHVRKQHFICVHEPDGPAFQREMQKVLNEAPNPKITYPPGLFVAYIEYTTEEQIAETLAEQHELDGDRHYCIECPHMLRTEDKRRKWFPCELKGHSVSFDFPACDVFYAEQRG